MIPRYRSPEIAEIWTDERKLALWQDTELAVIYASERLKVFPPGTYESMRVMLTNAPMDIEWWLAREKEVHHDLNAWLDERRRHLPIELHQYFHGNNMTSYDTEEPAFAHLLINSCAVVGAELGALFVTLRDMARKYRYTVMNGRTHGQEAELQSFGKRCLTWYRALSESEHAFLDAKNHLRYSKISGAIGNYGGLDPRVEALALGRLRLQPFYGATQIVPREVHFRLAAALLQMMLSLEKIALDIRLGARSGRPLWHEPFGKKQKGSSAMPHKKNTILTENVQGMARLARGYFDAIRENVVTWEERSIEQSSVERVAWADLFHAVVFALGRMRKVLTGLVVYPDHMLQEIVESRGCYASSEAKEFLKREGAAHGIDGEAAYRIVQLAAFNAFEPSGAMEAVRRAEYAISGMADDMLAKFELPSAFRNIRDIVERGELAFMNELETDPKTIEQWNRSLLEIFAKRETQKQWRGLFTPSYLLKHEIRLFKEVLGE
jgi:adenylosuccinate lyase